MIPLDLNLTPESRSEVERLIYDLIATDFERLAVRTALRAGHSPEDTTRGVLLFIDLLCSVFEALPPREGRGGLTKEGRAVNAYVKRWRARPESQGRGRPRTHSDAAVSEFLSRVQTRIANSENAGASISRRAALIEEITESYQKQRKPNARNKAKAEVKAVEELLRRRAK